jgi:8-oxo-dGTP pyrophosphatase MutT (NUDIX family)
VSQAPQWLRDLAGKAAAVEFPPMAVPQDGTGKPSAVLILFGDGPDLLYIQRSDELRHHPGQPAFPGGSIDDTDAGPVACAVREAVEETGLDPSGVDIVGTMKELFIPRTGFRVVPVLAWWRRPSAVTPAAPAEVVQVERIPVAELADPAVRVNVRNPGGRVSPGFRVRGMLIWGFTALLTDMLLKLGGWERPWDAGEVTDIPMRAR